MHPESPATALLSYAPRPPWHRRRRAWKRIALAALLASGAALAVTHRAWWLRVRDHAATVRLQRECLNFRAPAGQVALTKGDGSLALRAPANSGLLAAPLWERLSGGAFGAPLTSTGTLFLHRLRTRSGVERLVVVELFVDESYHSVLLPVDDAPASDDWSLPPWEATDRIRVTVIKTGWSHAPRRVTVTDHDRVIPGGYEALTYWRPLTLFAGRPDPNDPARFVVPYWADGECGVIEGRLEEDGQTVSLKVVEDAAGRSIMPAPRVYE